MPQTIAIIFWLGIFLVFYTYLGYGCLLFALVKLKECITTIKPLPITEVFPDVTLLIAAYNEESVITDKMTNCKALQYPEGETAPYMDYRRIERQDERTPCPIPTGPCFSST